MKRQLFWLIAAILMVSPLLTSCSSNDNPTSEPVAPEPEVSNPILKALGEIPNVHDIREFKETAKYGFKEGYEFLFDQPIDHKNPAAGTFHQLVRLCVRDVNVPTVLWTEGYLLSDITLPIDLPTALGANLVQIEHRHFGESKILSDTRWEYLTLEQAAGDHHAIIQALKPLLPKEWISTGVSKNGMASIYLRYYYPDDIDVTTAFCAPLMTAAADIRAGRWMQQESGKNDVKPIIDAQLNRMFVNGEDGIYARFLEVKEKAVTKAGRKFKKISFERYVWKTLTNTFAFYMNTDAKQRQEKTYPIDCPADSLIKFFLPGLICVDVPANPDEEYYWEDLQNYPSTVQFVKQIGYANFDYSLFPALEGTSFDAENMKSPKAYNLEDLYECDMWLYDTYDNSVNLDILNNFLPNCEKPILLVYSQNDPWTGGRITNVNPVAKLIINPDGFHHQDINNPDHYSPALRQEIIDYIGKYVKLP